MIQPHRQHQTGGQPGQRPDLGPLKQGGHLGLFLRPDAVHHAPGKALGGLDLLQLSESPLERSQLRSRCPAVRADGQMGIQLPLLLGGQKAVQARGEKLPIFVTFHGPHPLCFCSSMV